MLPEPLSELRHEALDPSFVLRRAVRRPSLASIRPIGVFDVKLLAFHVSAALASLSCLLGQGGLHVGPCSARHFHQLFRQLPILDVDLGPTIYNASY